MNSSAIVRKSNHLIEARYKLSLGEQRLILLLVSQISPDDVDFKDYQIRVSDLANMFGLENDNRIYEKVEQAAESLVGKALYLSSSPERVKKTVWLSYAEYTKGSGVVEMRFDKSLKPYLLQLKAHFTQYQLKRVVHFKSQYSIRLYELLKAEEFKAKNGWFKRTFEVEDLRLRFGVDENEYSSFKNFRVRVIEPAVREISKNSDLNIIQVDYPKTGRQITHIVFHVEKAKQVEMDLESGSPVVTVKESERLPDDVQALVSLGISQEIAMKWRKKYGKARIERNIGYTRAQTQAGAVKDVKRFLSKAISEDYGGEWKAEQDARDAKRKAEAEAERKREAEERNKTEQAKNQTQLGLEAFWKLPEPEQQATRTAFPESQAPVIRKLWKETMSKQARPEEAPQYRASFVKFLMERGSI